MKIVVLDGFTLNPGDISWDQLEKLGTVTIYDRTPEELIVSRIGDAEIVVTNKTPLSSDTIRQCPAIRFIAVLATGFNVVDIEYAKQKGIPVSNIPTYGTKAVAQFVFALLLEGCHHVQRHSDAVFSGRWSTGEDFCFWDFPLIELAGKTMGIVGCGRIGQDVARVASSFGMSVLGYDAHTSPEKVNELCDMVSFENLLANSDVISLHCPLNEGTYQLINDTTLSKMKDGVILINTSRGPLINEVALASALNNGKVSFAAVDVVSKEPIQHDNPLLHAKNIIITPHIAWAPKESRQRLMDVAVSNINAFLAGKPQNVVNG